VLMGYPGAFQDNYVKAVAEPFMAAHPAIKVIYSPSGNSAQMLGLLRAQKAAPQFDVDIMDFSVSRVANKDSPSSTPRRRPTLPTSTTRRAWARASGPASPSTIWC